MEWSWCWNCWSNLYIWIFNWMDFNDQEQYAFRDLMIMQQTDWRYNEEKRTLSRLGETVLCLHLLLFEYPLPPLVLNPYLLDYLSSSSSYIFCLSLFHPHFHPHVVLILWYLCSILLLFYNIGQRQNYFTFDGMTFMSQLFFCLSTLRPKIMSWIRRFVIILIDEFSCCQCF